MITINDSWLQFNAKVSPFCCVVKKETWFNANQLKCDADSCETSELWGSQGIGSSLPRQLCSAPVCLLFCASLLWPALTCSGPLQGDIFGISAQPGRYIYSFLDRKGKCSLRVQEAGLYRQKLLPLVPHANVDSKSSQFDWSKRHCYDWS